LWKELLQATHDRHHPWRTPVWATSSDDGPDARTVVLREAAAAQQLLVIYTDARAAKVAQLRRDERALLVFWSPALGWQLRCRVRATVHDAGLAATSRWVRVQQSPAVQDYLSPQAPGTPLDNDRAARPPSRQRHGVAPDAETGPAPSPAHFAVIEASVQSIDWLELHPDGHRRARFDSNGSRWLQP
jgi:pyridoxine/pyridoxamine 5'-phosphate oxidase